MDKKLEIVNNTGHEPQSTGEGEAGAKNQYTTPHLVEYGTIAKLTRTGTGVITEGGMGSTGCL